MLKQCLNSKNTLEDLMKNKFIITVLSLMAIFFLSLTIKDYLASQSVIKDALTTIILAILAILSFKDMPTNPNTKFSDERDEHVSYLSDHKTVVFLEWLSLSLFVLLILIYQLINSNLMIGVLAIMCLLYWAVINVLRIIIYLFLIKD